MNRLDKEEAQQKDMMQIIKLLQNYNDNQDEENQQFRSLLSNMTQQIKNIEKKVSDQSQPNGQKDQYLKDYEQLVKELTQDIIKLSKKIENKDQVLEQKLRCIEEELKINTDKIMLIFERDHKRYNQIKQTEKQALSRAKQVAEQKTLEMKQDYESLQRKIDQISRDVKLSNKKKQMSKSAKQTIYSNNKQDNSQIIDRIQQLETDLNNIKHTQIQQLSHSIDQGILSQSSFTPNQRKPLRGLSNSAVKLQDSLEKRVNNRDRKFTLSNKKQTQIREKKSGHMKIIEDISFSSGSNERYHNTAKSQQKRVIFKDRSNSSNNHRKSYDAIIQVESHRNPQIINKSHTYTHNQQKDQSFSQYIQKKEQIIQQRAKRMIELSNLSISQLITKSSKQNILASSSKKNSQKRKSSKLRERKSMDFKNQQQLSNLRNDIMRQSTENSVKLKRIKLKRL